MIFGRGIHFWTQIMKIITSWLIIYKYWCIEVFTSIDDHLSKTCKTSSENHENSMIDWFSDKKYKFEVSFVKWQHLHLLFMHCWNHVNNLSNIIRKSRKLNDRLILGRETRIWSQFCKMTTSSSIIHALLTPCQ